MAENTPNQKFSFDDIFLEASCDRRDSLYEYFQGILSERHPEEFLKHLSACATCTRLLAELEESKLAAENTVLDVEQADRLFRQNRVKIEDRLNQKFGIQQRPVLLRDLFRFPAYVNVMMIVLVAVLIYPSYRSFVLDQQVAQLRGELATEKARMPEKMVVPQTIGPSVSAALVYPVRNERDPEQKTIRITQKDSTLVFSIPSEEFEGYLIAVSRNGQLIWQSKSPVKSNLLSLTLHANDFPSGSYVLTVYGMAAEKKTSLTMYKLLIE